MDSYTTTPASLLADVQAGVDDLFSRFGVAMDIDTDVAMSLARSIYTKDAVFVIKTPDGGELGPYVGREAAYNSHVTLKKNERSEGRRGRHVMSNLLVTHATADTAEVIMYMLYFTFSTDNATVINTTASGHYEAKVVREDGVWRFRHLRLHLDNVPPAVVTARRTGI